MRSFPTICSHIHWARLLFSHLKKPVLKFQKVEELKRSLLKIEAFNNYLKVAKSIKAYEQEKFEEWKSKAMEVVHATLRMNVLKVQAKRTGSKFLGKRGQREGKLLLTLLVGFKDKFSLFIY